MHDRMNGPQTWEKQLKRGGAKGGARNLGGEDCHMAEEEVSSRKGKNLVRKKTLDRIS